MNCHPSIIFCFQDAKTGTSLTGSQVEKGLSFSSNAQSGFPCPGRGYVRGGAIVETVPMLCSDDLLLP